MARKRSVCRRGLHAMTPENLYRGACRECRKARDRERDRTLTEEQRERMREYGAAYRQRPEVRAREAQWKRKNSFYIKLRRCGFPADLARVEAGVGE